MGFYLYPIMQDSANHTTFGRFLAQQNDGKFEIYKSELDKLKEANQSSSALDSQKLRDEISDINQKIIAYNSEIIKRTDPTNGKIKLLDDEVNKLEGQIYEIDRDKTKAEKYSTFNLSRLIIYIAFIIPLSFYLIFYYTAISKSVFNGLNPDSIINGENLSLPILPDFQELSDALKTNFMLILIPFAFFCFGLALHIVMESKNKYKVLFMAAITAVILTADSAMAYKIHSQALLALSLIMDKADIATFIELTWYLDINFYIVLILGFVVFVIWSIIFHAILVEWSKKNVARVLRNQVLVLESDIKVAKAEINEYKEKIDRCEQELKDAQKKNPHGINGLIASIEAFTIGWVEFLDNVMPKREENVKEVKNHKESFIKSLKND